MYNSSGIFSVFITTEEKDMYEYTPDNRQSKSKRAAICLMVGAAAMFLAVSAIDAIAFKGVFQIISFLVFGLGILFITKSMKRVTYRITEPTEEGSDLTVTEIQGKSRITVCRLSVSGITETLVCGREELVEQKKRIRKEKKKFYNYTADIMEEKVIVIHAVECGEPIAVILSYDETLFTYFL